MLFQHTLAFGLFTTLAKPTRDTRVEAVGTGFSQFDVWQADFPMIQIRTVQELLSGTHFEIPYRPPMYAPAQRVERSEGRQGRLDDTVGRRCS